MRKDISILVFEICGFVLVIWMIIVYFGILSWFTSCEKTKGSMFLYCHVLLAFRFIFLNMQNRGIIKVRQKSMQFEVLNLC